MGRSSSNYTWRPPWRLLTIRGTPLRCSSRQVVHVGPVSQQPALLLGLIHQRRRRGILRTSPVRCSRKPGKFSGAARVEEGFSKPADVFLHRSERPL